MFKTGFLRSAAVFVALMFAALALLSVVDKKTQNEQTALLEQAVRRAVITCYAVEGRYPDTIEYLQKHYGLAYDSHRFIIRYDAFASNVMPDIVIMVRGGGRI